MSLESLTIFLILFCYPFGFLFFRQHKVICDFVSLVRADIYEIIPCSIGAI